MVIVADKRTATGAEREGSVVEVTEPEDFLMLESGKSHLHTVFKATVFFVMCGLILVALVLWVLPNITSKAVASLPPPSHEHAVAAMLNIMMPKGLYAKANIRREATDRFGCDVSDGQSIITNSAAAPTPEEACKLAASRLLGFIQNSRFSLPPAWSEGMP